MKTEDAATLLERLKGYLGAETDGPLEEALGVSRATISGWRGRNSVPYKHLVEFAKREGHISLDWLLLGEGSPERGAGDPPNPERPGLEGSSLQELWAAEGRAFKEDSDLGRRARLARLGRTRQAWMLLEVLAHQPSEGMTLAKLSEGVGSTPDETLSYLSLLIQAGLVAEGPDEDGGRFRLTSEFLELTFGEPADISQMGMEAIRQILRVVVPATERREGRLSVGVGQVRKGRSLELAQELIQIVMSRCQETVDDPPEEEMVIVLGVAKGPGPMLPSPSNPEGAKLS